MIFVSVAKKYNFFLGTKGNDSAQSTTTLVVFVSDESPTETFFLPVQLNLVERASSALCV